MAKGRQPRLLLHGSDTLMQALEQDRWLTMAERKAQAQAKSKERKAQAQAKSTPKPKPPHAQDHASNGGRRVSASHAALTLEQALQADGASQNSAYAHAGAAAYPTHIRDLVRQPATVHTVHIRA